jgi:hypothetical protein
MLSAEHTATTSHWLRTVTPSTKPPTPASRSATIAHAVGQLGTAPVAWACEVAAGMTTHIVAVIPEFGGGIVPFETLRMCIESVVIRCMLRLITSKRTTPAITDEALTGVVEFVQRGIRLELVLRGIRLGHAQMAKALLSACSDVLGPTTRTDHMQHISDELFDYFDELCDAVASAYTAERDRWMSSAAASRGEAVRQILRDEPVDRALIQKVLDYEFERHHVASILWYEPSSQRADTSELESAALDVLEQLGAIHKLIVPTGAGRILAWGNRRQFSDDSELNRERPDIHVAVGTPCAGLAGFRRSHREALAAERVARMSPLTARTWTTTYHDTAVVAMLTADFDTARHFVRRELGPLAAGTLTAADLRATLLSYLEEESSPFAAARHLHVSRNTVGYRVKRASELLGYDIATRRYPLHTALLLVDHFGQAVLADDSAENSHVACRPAGWHYQCPSPESA